MFIDSGMVISGFVSKVVNDCVDVLKEKIKDADKNRKSDSQNLETRIYQVTIDVLNKFTKNKYKGQDILYDATECILKGFKSNGDNYLEAVKSGITMLGLQVTVNKCEVFLRTLRHEICKDENNDLYKELMMHRQEQVIWNMHEDLIKSHHNEEKAFGKEDTLKKVNIFLSYCWNDSSEANKIYVYFKNSQNIELHRDTIDIGKWGSIKKYMQSISNMDYTILLISDSYLKSANCMYEVLEVMRDRNYKDKIFPAVIYSEIYSPITRAKYVKYWQDEFRELESTLKEINVQNLGKLSEDLKRRQDISSNIAEFLYVVSDMNNPNINDVCVVIEEKLSQKGFLENNQIEADNTNELFATLSISKAKYNSEPTDLEINQFVRNSFSQIVELLAQLCQQYQKQNVWIKVQIEQVDTRTIIYQFYKNGQLVRGLRLFLSNMFGGRRENISLSDNIIPFGGNSWSGIYDAKFIDGELKLYATISLMNSQKVMGVQEVVADIWEYYIQTYLER